EGAGPVLGSYLKQGMRFFVAKVNLEEQAKAGYQMLRPLQVAYESPKFMLPIRLGTVNGDGPQELFVYTLTRTGRVETTNYRTVKLPTGMNLPVATKERFGEFYKALFSEQTRRENSEVVFLEYAWDMAWCDPCAADPLSSKELRELGVFWVDDGSPSDRPGIAPRPVPSPAQNVFVSRLHVRYDRDHFPEDLRFQETGDRDNFQGRYVLQHAWNGESQCAAAEVYRRGLPERQDKEAQTLASLTGWDIDDIRGWAGLSSNPRVPAETEPWWKRLWSRE
ncbi:MAG: DUF2330 domain-containing protein, partial [bacterium]|nr:DUF2330 domain-containing protein [bacterium]